MFCKDQKDGTRELSPDLSRSRFVARFLVAEALNYSLACILYIKQRGAEEPHEDGGRDKHQT